MFEAMGVLGRNDVVVLLSVTGADRSVVPADALNLGFVIGNKVMVGRIDASPSAGARRALCAQCVSLPVTTIAKDQHETLRMDGKAVGSGPGNRTQAVFRPWNGAKLGAGAKE